MASRPNKLVRETLATWKDAGGSLLGAATAFGAALALAPLLVIAVAVAGAVFGNAAARQELERRIAGALGDAETAVVLDLLRNASEPRSSGLAALLGSAAIVVFATNFCVQLQDALNRVWGVEPRSDLPFRTRLRRMFTKRLLSFGLVVLSGIMLVALAVEKIVLAALTQWLLPGIVQLIELPFSVALMSAMLAVVYRYLPDGTVGWRHAWSGAVLTAVVVSIATVAVGFYLARTGGSSAAGAASSVFALLTWLLVCAQIFYAGASFTVAHARIYGAGVRPDQNAVRVIRGPEKLPPISAAGTSREQPIP